MIMTCFILKVRPTVRFTLKRYDHLIDFSAVHPSASHPSSQYSADSSLVAKPHSNINFLISLAARLYRAVFKRFEVFNAVQSACFDDVSVLPHLPPRTLSPLQSR
jgi:hypothetical protein